LYALSSLYVCTSHPVSKTIKPPTTPSTILITHDILNIHKIKDKGEKKKTCFQSLDSLRYQNSDKKETTAVSRQIPPLEDKVQTNMNR
jgi:hypothetical protein